MFLLGETCVPFWPLVILLKKNITHAGLHFGWIVGLFISQA